MCVCMYVGQQVCEGDISRGPTWSSNTNISLLSYCSSVCVEVSACNVCFSRRCFEARICKRSGMLLKFDTTLCSPVCLHHALLLPLIICGVAVFKRRMASSQIQRRYQVILDTVKKKKKKHPQQALWCRRGTGLVSVGLARPLMWVWDDGCSQWKLSSQCSTLMFIVDMHNWVWSHIWSISIMTHTPDFGSSVTVCCHSLQRLQYCNMFVLAEKKNKNMFTLWCLPH